MKILGIDSSGLVASAAVLADGILVSEWTVNNRQTHSQTLLPMIDQVIKMSEISLEELDAVAVASGPGSFTGLRIGASTAKGMALALKLPIVPVPTLEGLAYRAAVSDSLICPMMDARRNQVYTGLYRVTEGRLVIVREQCAVAVQDIVGELNRRGERALLLGDGVQAYQEYISQNVAVPFSLAPAHLDRQSAGAVAALGEIYFRQGKAETAAQHRPVYLRKSQAEREREQKMQGSVI